MNFCRFCDEKSVSSPKKPHQTRKPQNAKRIKRIFPKPRPGSKVGGGFGQNFYTRIFADFVMKKPFSAVKSHTIPVTPKTPKESNAFFQNLGQLQKFSQVLAKLCNIF